MTDLIISEGADVICRRRCTRTGAFIRSSMKAPHGSEIWTTVPRTVVHHSPTGFEWGYAGSGPADLSLNILNMFVPPEADDCPAVDCYSGKSSLVAWNLHQDFKREFIAPLPDAGGVIRAEVIREWIKKQVEAQGL